MDLRKRMFEENRYKKRSDKRNLVATWSDRELLDGELEEAFTVIFRTRGCGWAHRMGCTMCGYHTDTNPDISNEDISKQLEEALSRYNGETIVKLYTSGSFLDPKEIPKDLAQKIISSFDCSKTVIESRPEYVNQEVLKDLKVDEKSLEIAIGLESADDFVLKNCINKGFTFKDYMSARKIVLDAGCGLRTYLLLKPPFLTEKEAMDDLIKSIERISHKRNLISINPVNVQNNSFLEHLFRLDMYRPPWLWSLLEILKEIKSTNNIVISRAGLGGKRGAHNCGGCDKEIVDLLDDFNRTRDIEKLSRGIPECDCKKIWRSDNWIEPALHFRGSPEILSNRYAGYV